MAINVEVSRSGNENNLSILRRFTKRVQGSGILMHLRKNRYASRKPSEYTKKKSALKRLAEKMRKRELIKMGKMPGTLE